MQCFPKKTTRFKFIHRCRAGSESLARALAASEGAEAASHGGPGPSGPLASSLAGCVPVPLSGDLGRPLNAGDWHRLPVPVALAVTECQWPGVGTGSESPGLTSESAA